MKYVENAGFCLDLKIIFATIGQVFSRKSIYEKRYSLKEETRGESAQLQNQDIDGPA